MKVLQIKRNEKGIIKLCGFYFFYDSIPECPLNKNPEIYKMAYVTGFGHRYFLFKRVNVYEIKSLCILYQIDALLRHN